MYWGVSKVGVKEENEKNVSRVETKYELDEGQPSEKWPMTISKDNFRDNAVFSVVANIFS